MTNAEILAHFRTTQPQHAGLSDDIILSNYAESLRQSGELDNFPELREYWRAEQRAAAGNIVQESGRALAAGLRADLPAIGWGAASALADTAARAGRAVAETVVGPLDQESDNAAVEWLRQTAAGNIGKLEETREAFIERVRENQLQGQELRGPVSVESFDDVENFADFMRWAAPGVARTIPQSLPIIGASLAAGPAGTAAALTAAGVTGVGTGIGQQYADLATNEEADPDKILPAALVGGTLAGSLDAASALVPLFKLMPGLGKVTNSQAANAIRKVLDKSPLKAWADAGGVRGAAAGAVEGLASESLTESLQTLVEIAGEEYATGNDVPADEVFSRVREAAILGGLAGGLMTGTFGALPRQAEATQAPPTPDPELDYTFNADHTLGSTITPLAPDTGQSTTEVPPATGVDRTQAKFYPGELVNVLGPNATPTAIGLEIVSAQRAPEAGNRWVYQVRPQDDPDADPVPVTENQLRLFDFDGPVERRFREREAKAADDEVKSVTLTDDLRAAARSLGYTDDLILTTPASELLQRVREAEFSAARAVVADAQPAASADTDLFGEPVTTPAPLPYTLDSETPSTEREAASAEPPVPANVRTIQQYATWQANNRRKAANENLARQRSQDADDVRAGQTLITEALPEISLTQAQERQLNRAPESQEMAAAADADIEAAQRFDSQLQELANAKRNELELRYAGNSEALANIDRKVEDYVDLIASTQAAQADTNYPDLAPVVAAHQRVVAALRKSKTQRERATQKAHNDKQRRDSSIARVRAYATEKWEKAGVSPDEAKAKADALQISDESNLNDIRRQISQEIADWRLANKVSAPADPVQAGETQTERMVRNPILSGVGNAVILPQPIVGADLDPNAKGAAALPESLRKFLARWSVTERRGEKNRKLPSKASDSKRGVAVQNPDGSVDYHQIYMSNTGWRLQNRPTPDQTEAIALSKIQANLKAKGISTSDISIKRVLANESTPRVSEATRNAILDANESVGWAVGRAPLAFGKDGVLSNRPIVALILGRPGKALGTGYAHYPSMEAFEAAAKQANADAQAAGEFTDFEGETNPKVTTVGVKALESEAAPAPDAADVEDARIALAQQRLAARGVEVSERDIGFAMGSSEARGRVDANLLPQIDQVLAEIDQEVAPPPVIQPVAAPPVTQPVAAPPVTPALAAGTHMSAAPKAMSSADYDALLNSTEDNDIQGLRNLVNAIGSRRLEKGSTGIGLYAEMSDPLPHRKDPNFKVRARETILVGQRVVEGLQATHPLLAKDVQNKIDAARQSADEVSTLHDTVGHVVMVAFSYYSQFKKDRANADIRANLRRMSPADGLKIGPQHLKKRFETIVSTMLALGINVDIFQLNADRSEFFAQEGGRYIPSERLVQLVVSDLANPSQSAAITALHEIMHDQIRQLPYYVQQAMHQAMTDATNRGLVQLGNAEADTRMQSGVRPENMDEAVWLEEQFVEDKALTFIDKDFSRSVYARTMRRFREMYYQAKAWLVHHIGLTASPNLANALLEIRLKRILSGDFYGEAVVEAIAREKNSVAWAIRRAELAPDSPGSLYTKTMIPLYQFKEYEASFADREQLFTVRAVDPSVLEEARKGSRQKQASDARTDIAAYNELENRLVATYNQLRTDGVLDGSLSFDQYISTMGVTDPRKQRDRIYEALSKSFGSDPIPFAKDVLIGQLSVRSEIDQAYETLSKALNKLRIKANEGAAKMRADSDALRESAHAGIEQYSKIKDKFYSAQAADQLVREWVVPQLEVLRKDMQDYARISEQKGAATAQLEYLEDMTERPEGIPAPEYYEKLVRKLDINNVPLISIITTLSDLPDSAFHGKAADVKAEIRRLAETNEALQVLFTDRGSAHPLLAALIAMRKTQAHLFDVVRMRLETAENRAAITSQLAEIMAADTDQRLDQIKADIKENNKLRNNNLIARYINLKRKINRDLKASSKYALGAELLRRTEPALNKLADQVSAFLTQGQNFELVDQAYVWVPEDANTPDAALGDVNFRQQLFLNVTDDATIRGWIAKQTAWLDVRTRPEQHNRTYHTVLRMRDELKTHLLRGNSGKLSSGLIGSGRLSSIVDLLKRTGTLAGRRMAGAWTSYVGMLRRFSGRDKANGHAWSKALKDLGRATGYPNNQALIDQLFFQPLAHVAGAYPTSTLDELVERAVVQVRLNPNAAELIRKPGALAAFRELARSTAAANRWYNEKRQIGGMPVVEDDLSTSPHRGEELVETTRRAIARGTMTIPVSPSESILALIEEMRSNYQKLRDKPNSYLAGDATTLVADEDRPAANVRFWFDVGRVEEVRQELRTWFNDDVVERFIEPLVFNFTNPLIKSPKTEESAAVVLDPAQVAEAWAESNKDVIAFADNLAARFTEEGQTPDLPAWRESTVKFFAGKFMQLDRIVQRSHDNQTKTLGGIPHVAMDSRKAFDLPQEFLRYMTFDADANAVTSNAIAANAAFGRDMARYKSMATVLQADLNARAQRIKDLMLVSGETTDRALARWVKLNGWKGQTIANPTAWVKESRDAEAMLRHVDADRIADLTRAVISPASGIAADIGIAHDIFSLAVSLLLATPKTAIKNIQSFIDTMTYFRVTSSQGLKALRRAFTEGGLNVLYSAMTVFGLDLGKRNINNVRLKRIGQLDETGGMTWSERAAQAGRGFNLENGRGRIQYFIRVARDVLADTTIRRTGPEFYSVAARIPTGVFNWSTMITNIGATSALYESYADVIRSALDLFTKNPERLNQIQNGGKLNAKELGYTDGWILKDAQAFENLREQAALAGVVLEDMILEARSRDQQGLDYFDDRTLTALAERVTSEVVREGSPTTRPPDALKSAGGRIAMTLTGWSWSKMWQLLNMARHPEQGYTAESIVRAAIVLSAFMLPANMLFAWLLDTYDEEVLGKASNVRPLRLSDDIGSIALAVNERAALTGAFGFFSDLANGIFNQGGANGEPVSVDSKVVFISLAKSLESSLSRLFAVGIDDANYATVYRQLLNSFGGGGPIQYIQMMNKLGDWTGVGPISKAESDYTARLNINNILRVVGRELKFEGRPYSAGTYRIQESTPYATAMAIAALTGDRDAFFAARTELVRKYREEGKADPIKLATDNLAGRHPLRSNFKTPLSAQEVQMIFQRLPEDQRESLRRGLASYNSFLASIGGTPFWGVMSRQEPVTQERQDLRAFRERLLED
jgi:hypothetical protein